MPVIKARVVPEEAAGYKSILAPPVCPAITGDGTLDIICGACGTVLIKSVRPYLVIRNIVIRCPHCHKCNDAG